MKIKINYWQQALNHIENYKTQGSIIRRKQKLIAKEKQSTNFFSQSEKQEPAKIQNKQFQNDHNNLLTTNSDILKGSQKFYQNLYLKTYNETQKNLQKSILKQVQIEQNQELTKYITKKRTKRSYISNRKLKITRHT